MAHTKPDGYLTRPFVIQCFGHHLRALQWGERTANASNEDTTKQEHLATEEASRETAKAPKAAEKDTAAETEDKPARAASAEPALGARADSGLFDHVRERALANLEAAREQGLAPRPQN